VKKTDAIPAVLIMACLAFSFYSGYLSGRGPKKSDRYPRIELYLHMKDGAQHRMTELEEGFFAEGYSVEWERDSWHYVKSPDLITWYYGTGTGYTVVKSTSGR
jgi:hypothetical protein